MIELPEKSKLKCINPECKELPTFVLVGQHKRPDYQIQVRSCAADAPIARQVAKQRFPTIKFGEEASPPWLAKAQNAELKLKDRT